MEAPKRNLDSTKPQKIGDRYGVNTLNKGFYKKNGKQRRDDEKWITPVRGLILSSALFFYWEILTALVTSGRMGANVVYMLASSVFAAALVSLVSGIFGNENVNFVISYIIKLAVGVLFMAEIVYEDMSGSYFGYSTDASAYSAGDVLNAIARSWWKLILVLIPLIAALVIYCLYRRIEEDILGYARRNIACYILIVVVAVLAYSGLMLTVNICDSDDTPVFTVLYDRNTNYDQKVEEFGIITSVAQDVKRSLFE